MPASAKIGYRELKEGSGNFVRREGAGMTWRGGAAFSLAASDNAASLGRGPRLRAFLPAALLACATAASIPSVASADEGGISFWVPGFMTSFAASPLVPGFSFANIGYHTTVNAGADVAFARQVTLGRLTTNFTGGLNIALNGDGNLYMAIPSYTFAERFLGGQATFAVAYPMAARSARWMRH
jgi:hypothetical protein